MKKILPLRIPGFHVKRPSVFILDGGLHPADEVPGRVSLQILPDLVQHNH